MAKKIDKNNSDEQKPYIVKVEIIKQETRFYNPQYGDDRTCKCGHSYYRHFDTYEQMYPCGCKYCQCGTFVEKKTRVTKSS